MDYINYPIQLFLVLQLFPRSRQFTCTINESYTVQNGRK